MTLKKIIRGSIILAGLAGLLGCTDKEKKDNAVPEEPDRNMVIREDGKKEYTVSLGQTDLPPEIKTFGYYPKEVNQNVHVEACPTDEGKNRGIAWTAIYEDGQKVFETDNSGCCGVNIKHTRVGTHDYFAETRDLGGHVARSKTISVEFSGKPLDDPPVVYIGVSEYSKDLTFYGFDRFDREDTKESRLYEDGKLIKTIEFKKGYVCGTDIPLHELWKEGTHIYQAEAEDKKGNVTKSKLLTITYVK